VFIFTIYYYNNNYYYNYRYYLAFGILCLNFFQCEILLNIFKSFVLLIIYLRTILSGQNSSYSPSLLKQSNKTSFSISVRRGFKYVNFLYLNLVSTFKFLITQNLKLKYQNKTVRFDLSYFYL
jgi:hypothetical protein